MKALAAIEDLLVEQEAGEGMGVLMGSRGAWWTRNQILSGFVRLSEVINEKYAEGVLTHEETALTIDRYRERAEILLTALKQAQKVRA